jgi:hypothetical protein
VKVLEVGQLMASVVVDIDDTLIDTGQRLHKVWNLLLNREISMKAIETLSLEQIFLKFASKEQKSRVKEFQKRFWDILLCLEAVGIKSLELHKPIPFAADVLQTWSGKTKIIYLTGRTENVRSLTLDELKRFRFPTQNTQLVMFKPKDYARPRGENPSGPTLIDTKSNLCSEVCRSSNVVRVIDDYPGYFPIFKQFEIPDRIGFLRSKKYSPQHYTDRGATRVIESWKELQGDMPELL